MNDIELFAAVGRSVCGKEVKPYTRVSTLMCRENPIKGVIVELCADDPILREAFVKHLLETKEGMTVFEILSLDVRAWCVAFLKAKGIT